MARVAGSLKSSVNAGQLSKSLYGKVNLKQYYSGAKAMQGLEPVPQSGFTLLPGSRRVGAAASATVAKGVLRVSNTLSYTLVITPGSIDIWRNDLVKVATVAAAELTAGLIPYLTFYGEANTFGIFHPDLPSGVRLFRNASNDTIWTKSAWPYDLVPDVDLGGSYAQTVDQWDIFIRWATGVPGLMVSCSVDGTTVPSVSLGVEPDSADPSDWVALGDAMQAEISSLAGFGSGVSVAFLGTATRYVNFRVQFGGPLTGSEYEFDVQIVNTSDASALVSHVAIGDTAGEPLISVARGGFAGMTLFQDRACYFGPKARQTAIAMSRVAEYFDLNIEATADNGARLEALRSATSESIYHLLDTTYLLAFTDQAEYFASNRTIERNKPLNWVRASEIGSKRTCRPVTLEGKAYFVSNDGSRLYSFGYNAVSEMFEPVPLNYLNEDLVSDIKLMAVQKKQGKMGSDRLWMLREDGLLVCCNVVTKTEDGTPVLAATLWPVAGGGTVHGLSVDGQGQVWLTVERGGAIAEEVLEEGLFFQHSVSVTTNASGIASGLSVFNGKTIWGFFDNDAYGPVTVADGSADFGVASATGVAGLWQAPVYESMPYVRVLGNDDVVRRPGKVVSGRFYLEDTASIAIGANGQAVKDQPLDRASDDLEADKVNFTGHLTVCGLKGVTMDPTITISQVRPGALTVRDYIPGVKL